MKIKPVGLGISYSHTSKEDKHFFGGFLNLAVHNIELLFAAFKNKFSFRNNTNLDIKNFVQTAFSKKISDHDFEIRRSFLQTHFPVIKYLDHRDKEVFKQQLGSLFATIDRLRSFYTHYYHAPINLSNGVYDLLDQIFTVVALDVKANKVKDDKSRHLLKKTLSVELDSRYKLQFEKLKELKAEGVKVNLNDKDAIQNGVLNSAFNHLIYKSDDGNISPTRRYESRYSEMEFAENEITISQSGLLFLISFFLRRKEIEDLKSRVMGFKAKIIKDGEEKISGLKYMATHWVFSHLSLKEPKQSLHTGFDRETLLLQIIDELSKVPDEVYHAFDPETRDLFVEDINQYLKEGNDAYTLGEATVIHPVIRKRYEDKFNYFAIRYLDEFAGFKSLRFQVHLGNYVHDKRIKNIAGTEFQTERQIRERIKVFGKLSDAQKLKSEFFSREGDVQHDPGWEMLPNPSYIFIDNNIPIFLNVDQEVKDAVKAAKNNRIDIQPDERKRRSSGKVQKHIMVNEISQNKLSVKEPTGMLSLNEIPALLYEILVKGTSPDAIEDLLKSKIKERVQTIKHYDPNSPLPASKISKRIRNNSISSGRQFNTEKLKQLISKELLLADEKLQLIYKNRNELSKKVQGKILRKYIFGFSELGKEASWIAEDIKRFMPAQSRSQWKGYHHAQLQQSLSYYESRPNEALNILRDNWNFDDESVLWNHWIVDSFKEKSFDRFYERYLKEKKDYLQNFSENLHNYTSAPSKLLQKFLVQQMPKNFFDTRLYVLESLEQEKDKILSNPMVFPRGLFDPAPTFIKGIRVTEQPELFAAWYSYGYLPDHGFQKFYDIERDYNELIQDDTETRSDRDKNKVDFSKEEQYALIKKKQDLKIKNIKIQDLFLKLIAEKLFSDIFEYSSEIRLPDLYLTQAERMEKEKNAVEQSKKTSGDYSDNIINDSFIWSKTIPYDKGQIYEPAVKLKDIGKFKYFLNDAKIRKLLSYDEEKIWTKMEIENEISIGEKSYESIRRESIFKELQKLEKWILSYYEEAQHPAELELEGYPNFKKYIVNGILRKYNGGIIEDDCQWLEDFDEKSFENPEAYTELKNKHQLVQQAFLLVYIRNKFAHNQLPVKDAYQYILANHPDTRGQTVSEKLLNFVVFVLENFMR